MDVQRSTAVATQSDPRISVVVCTYNRAGLLRGLLPTLCEQSADPSDYEVIVVDNNSSDRTPDVVTGFCSRFRNVHYVCESRRGLSHARNRGWRESRGRYVAYVDDDARVPQTWIASATKVIDAVDPAVVGGPYYPFYDSPKPKWFKDAYASSALGNKARVLDAFEFLSGSNFMVRREVLERLGGFDPRLGMAGSTVGYGEETELQKRMRREMPGEAIHYEPALYVRHRVSADKMTMRWMARHYFVAGRFVYHVFGPMRGCGEGGWALCREAARALGAFSTELARAVLWRDRRRYPYFQNHLCERVLPHLETLGRIVEQCSRGRRNVERGGADSMTQNWLYKETGSAS